jgi:site-specific DNA recombinase
LIGAVRRASAADIEPKILEAIRTATSDRESESKKLLQIVQRVRLEPGHITIELTEGGASSVGKTALQLNWSPRPKKIKRDIILPHIDPTKDQRPIRAERRSALLRAIALGRSYLKELSRGTELEIIAARENRSTRSVQMTVSLAFVAPDIVEAAVTGALPRGVGLTRLMNLSPLWTDQRRELGLKG